MASELFWHVGDSGKYAFSTVAEKSPSSHRHRCHKSDIEFVRGLASSSADVLVLRTASSVSVLDMRRSSAARPLHMRPRTQRQRAIGPCGRASPTSASVPAQGRPTRSRACRASSARCPVASGSLPRLDWPPASSGKSHVFEPLDGGVQVAAGRDQRPKVGVWVGEAHLRHQAELRGVQLRSSRSRLWRRGGRHCGGRRRHGCRHSGRGGGGRQWNGRQWNGRR